MNSTAVQHCANSFISCTGWATEPNCHACHKWLLVAELKYLQDLSLYLLMSVFFFYVPSAAVAWLPATSGPAAIGPAWSLLRWSRKYMCVSLLKKKKILLWAQLWLQPLWTFLKRVDRNTFVLCQQCLPSYQLASSLPATKPVNWSVLHPVCASFKSILCILKLIFQVKWNKDRKPR